MVPIPDDIVAIPTAGLWGGALPRRTSDGWTCTPIHDGVVLTADGQTEVTDREPEDPRGCGLSPDGRVFADASWPSLTILS
jgi:hypothetical protein